MTKKNNKVAFKAITAATKLASMGMSIAKTTKETDTTIGTYLLSEILHIEKHRNPTRLNKFFDMMQGGGIRSSAMHGYVQAVGNVHLVPIKDNEGKEIGKEYKVKAKRNIDTAMIIEAGTEKPWTKYSPEPEPQQFNLVKRIESLLKQAHKAADEKRLVGDTSMLDVIERCIHTEPKGSKPAKSKASA